MKNRALKLSLILLAVGLLGLPMASSAMLQCSQCNCSSGCFQKCFIGSNGPSQCMFYICRDLCFAGVTEVGAEDSLETFLTKLQAEAPGEEAEPAAAD